MMTRDLRAQIPKIQAPALVILTTENFPLGALPTIKRAFEEQLAPVPRHEIVVVPGSKHYVMFDAPEVFSPIWTGF
jgi:pimeloyl-ACP methyl ester carboxylesterase